MPRPRALSAAGGAIGGNLRRDLLVRCDGELGCLAHLVDPCLHSGARRGTNEHWPQGSARDGIGMVVAVALPIGEKVPPGSVL